MKTNAATSALRAAAQLEIAWRQRALDFECCGQVLRGVLTVPAGRPSAMGVVVVVGGPQYRVGSHRQFVCLARALAAVGHAVLRFDVRGMGDSEGETRSFEDLDADIEAAISAFLSAVPSLRHVALWGLCDGASAALLYIDRRADARVAALALANPWVRSEVTLARTRVRHYYLQRLRQPEFWRKVLRGQGLFRALRGFAGNLWRARAAGRTMGQAAGRPVRYQHRMARAWIGGERPILLLTSGQDETAQEFLDLASSDPGWYGALNQSQLTRVDLHDADHTFSRETWRRQVEAATVQWLGELSLPAEPD